MINRQEAARPEVATTYIEPGCPWQNPWIESFNARFRDEVLDCELFSSILEARVIADVWRDTTAITRTPRSDAGAGGLRRALAGRPHGGGGHELIDAPAGYGSRRPMTPGSLD